jgi:hypothetical protein
MQTKILLELRQTKKHSSLFRPTIRDADKNYVRVKSDTNTLAYFAPPLGMTIKIILELSQTQTL